MTEAHDLARALPIDLHGGAVFRRYTMDDLDAVWRSVDAERDRIGTWMPWVAMTSSIDDQRRWLERVTSSPDTLDGCGVFVGEELAGSAGLSWDPFRIEGEIGYWVRAGYEGRGLVTAATTELVRIGFRVIGLHRLVIRAGVANVRSRAVAERLGFVLEGVQRGAGRGSIGYYDHAVYSLLEDEWERARGSRPSLT